MGKAAETATCQTDDDDEMKREKKGQSNWAALWYIWSETVNKQHLALKQQDTDWIESTQSDQCAICFQALTHSGPFKTVEMTDWFSPFLAVWW